MCAFTGITLEIYVALLKTIFDLSTWVLSLIVNSIQKKNFNKEFNASSNREGRDQGREPAGCDKSNGPIRKTMFLSTFTSAVVQKYYSQLTTMAFSVTCTDSSSFSGL